MTRARALIFSIAVAAAAVAGVFAIGHSLALGAEARTTSNAQVARRTAQLDRYRDSLAAALSRKPPPLPPIPAATTVAAAPPVQVVYRRAAAPSGRLGDDGERSYGERRSEGEHDDD